MYMLSNTKLTARINGKLGKEFYTTIGSPQGDALSPIIFTVYMEAAIRQYQANMGAIVGDHFRLTTLYADDVDRLNEQLSELKSDQEKLPNTLGQFNLQMNDGKIPEGACD